VPEKLVDLDGPRLYRAERHSTLWGEEVTFTIRDAPYVAKIVRINAGGSISRIMVGCPPTTLFLLAGLARPEYGSDPELLCAVAFHTGDVVWLPAGSLYRLAAVEDVTLVECALTTSNA
jgi:hypothetical protein